MTPMPNLDLTHPAVWNRRVPVTEEACESKTCPCWRDGFAAGVRLERERRHARAHAPGLLLRLLASAVFIVLLAAWLAAGRN